MGRDKRNEAPKEHYTKMLRATMETEAWRALSSHAQALYIWLKLEWKGVSNNNNGKIRLSTRSAANKMGVNHKTAAAAFHDLQAKGFIVVTEPGSLGQNGQGKSPAYEITEFYLRTKESEHSGRKDGRKLFKQWRPGQDFPIVCGSANNPSGHNGKTKPCPTRRNNPVPRDGTFSASLSHETEQAVPREGTKWAV